MRITFLIGNGFDLNIGLKTSYSDFLDWYLTHTEGDNELILDFKKSIIQGLSLWADAEAAFGNYTCNFNTNEEAANAFLDCHLDFCKKLAAYLHMQENRLNYTSLEETIGDLFLQSIKDIDGDFREVQRNQIQQSKQDFGGGYIYNFVSFNYTRVLDECVQIVRKIPLGSRRVGNTDYKNSIGTLIHVHGYTDRDMAFGVNDETQIQNLALFKDLPEEYIGQIVKRSTNKLNEERIDEKVSDLIQSSDLIYIYGMSIGATDAIWWQRICKLLVEKPKVRLIIHQHNSPQEELFRRKIISYDRSIQQRFLQYSQLDDAISGAVAKRIHIAHGNIFSKFENLVNHDLNSTSALHSELVTAT